MRKHLWDLLALAGFTFCLAGLWLIYLPLALLFAGIACLAAAFWGAKLWAF